MKSTLFKWFSIWLGGMFIALLLFGFFGPQGRQIDLKQIDFTTTQSAELYFKNMRAYFYDLEEDESSKYHIYRIVSREETASKLHFMIISNWRMNEAYIMAESDQIKLEQMPLSLRLDLERPDTLTLNGKDAEANYRFAADLFMALEKPSAVGLIEEGKLHAFSQAEMKSLKKSLNDYFKLVGKLH